MCDGNWPSISASSHLTGIRFHSSGSRDLVEYIIIIDPTSPHTRRIMNHEEEEELEDARLLISNIYQHLAAMG